MGWKTDIHKATKSAAKLFDPRLNMRWRYQGTNTSLYLGDERIWSSAVNGRLWDYIHNDAIATVLQSYYSTPVDQLRQRDFNLDALIWWGHGSESFARFERLVSILLAADRRLGKNTQSIWLFTERDALARKISYMRISGGKQP